MFVESRCRTGVGKEGTYGPTSDGVTGSDGGGGRLIRVGVVMVASRNDDAGVFRQAIKRPVAGTRSTEGAGERVATERGGMKLWNEPWRVGWRSVVTEREMCVLSGSYKRLMRKKSK